MTYRRLRRFAFLSLLLVLIPGTSKAQLEGIIDIHAHAGPDMQPRRYDGLKFAREAKAAGMRGAVIKSHEIPTAQMVYLINQLVPGFQAWATLVLNRSVGGINPRAVELQAKVEGHFLKLVFMPTTDAETPRKHANNTPYVPVSKDGALLPETVEVLKLIMKNDLVLATGHVTPQDAMLLVSEAHKMGLRRIVVTHPVNQGTTMEQMQEEIKSGAYLELTGNPIIPAGQDGTMKIIPNPPVHKPSEWATIIHTIGPEHIILSGDFGRPDFPDFLPGWTMVLAALKGAGVTDAEIDLIARKNPAHLLGMDGAKEQNK